MRNTDPASRGRRLLLRRITPCLVVILIVLALLAPGCRRLSILVGLHSIRGPRDEIPRQTAAGTLARAPADTDWPCWRGPEHDGKSALTGIRTDWQGGLHKVWEVNFLCQGKRSPSWSAPVVRGDRLFVPGRDKQRDLLFCINARTGALVWLGAYEAKVRRNHGAGARATPCIDGEFVYTFGRGGDLACWQLADGKLAWRRNVNDAGGKEPPWGHSSSPLVWDDRVIVQGGGNALVTAFDKADGNLLWKSMQGKAGYAATVPLRAGDRPAVLVFHAEALAALDPRNGEALWSIPWKTSSGANATTPAIDGNTVFFTSGYETGCRAIRVGDGEPEILWTSKAMSSHHSDPVILDGFVYGYSGQSDQNKGDFKCLDLATGEEKWSTGELGWGTTLFVDGHLLCMDIDGNLFLVKPDPAALHKVAAFPGALGEIDYPAWTIPVAANGNLYVRYMQRLVCYSLLNH